jgi:hypothetical protein
MIPTERSFDMKLKKLAVLSLIFSFLFSPVGSSEEKLQITEREMIKLGAAIENYIIDTGRAPLAGNIKELAVLLESRDTTDISLKDAWGRAFHYTARNISRKNGGYLPQYWLASSGEKGSFDGFLKYILKTGRQEGEIIYSNGDFV